MTPPRTGPTVAVLLPARNALRTIEAALGSITDQTYPHTRVYVVDDASDDGTREFLQARPEWYTSLTVLPERRGWPAALNVAAGAALDDDCDVLFVMNADDLLRLDCIEECVWELLHHPELSFCVPLVQQVGGDDVVQRSLPGATLRDFAVHTPIVAFCAIWGAVWREVGGYATDVNLPPGSDGSTPMAGHNEIDFYVRLIKGGHRYSVLEHLRPLVYYRMHPEQLHRSVVSRADEAIALIHAKHPEILKERQREAPDD